MSDHAAPVLLRRAIRADPSAIGHDVIGPLHTGLRRLAEGIAAFFEKRPTRFRGT